MQQTVAPSSVTHACIAGLDKRGTRFSALPDRYLAPGCATIGAVSLDGLRGDAGGIAASNLGPVSCPLATAFADWARFGVDRAARQVLGSGLARIETFGSYSCRNIAGSGRRSAHSTAAAIDVSGFLLEDGRRITVATGWSAGDSDARRFLQIVHRSACKRFGTVLGPDYNAAHADHFHVELPEGSRRGGFCR